MRTDIQQGRSGRTRRTERDTTTRNARSLASDTFFDAASADRTAHDHTSDSGEFLAISDERRLTPRAGEGDAVPKINVRKSLTGSPTDTHP